MNQNTTKEATMVKKDHAIVMNTKIGPFKPNLPFLRTVPKVSFQDKKNGDKEHGVRCRALFVKASRHLMPGPS